MRKKLISFQLIAIVGKPKETEFNSLPDLELLYKVNFPFKNNLNISLNGQQPFQVFHESLQKSDTMFKQNPETHTR